MGYSLWGRKESDMTERLTHTKRGTIRDSVSHQLGYRVRERLEGTVYLRLVRFES